MKTHAYTKLCKLYFNSQFSLNDILKTLFKVFKLFFSLLILCYSVDIATGGLIFPKDIISMSSSHCLNILDKIRNCQKV